MEFVSSYDFEILYHQGKDNVVTDALSRQHMEITHLMIHEYKYL